jgi:hypothetical protein
MRSAFLSIITVPSEGEIRRRDMPWCGCVDACWNVASIVLCSLEYLLCVVGVVRDAIWGVGIEAIVCDWGFDDLGCSHNLCEIVDSELD